MKKTGLIFIFLFSLVQVTFAKGHHHHQEVIIIGGGVSGTALFYTLAEFSNVPSIALIEKHKEEGLVNSNSTQNSQTLHMGDIETNYSVEKATKVQKSAYMVKNYLDIDKHLDPLRYQNRHTRIFNKTKKMVVGIGKTEVETLEKRFQDLKHLFPKNYLVGRSELGELEPKLVEGRDPRILMNAYVSNDGYTVDYGLLAKSFSEKAIKVGQDRTKIYLGQDVTKIKRRKDQTFVVETANGDKFYAPVVIVSAGGYGLKFAKELGYGEEYALLSLAGSFFFTKGKWINNKVYTVQIPGLPFAAVHADPDVHDENLTRLGPTAKGIFMLERYNNKSIIPYFEAFNIKRPKNILALLKVLSEPQTFKFTIQNLIYDFPFIGKKSYLKQAQKIFPTITDQDIVRAKGWGGTRPQILNVKTKSLDLGDAQIMGDNILFNITPSPGATKCLGNAYRDVQQVMTFFKKRYSFDKERFDHLYIR